MSWQLPIGAQPNETGVRFRVWTKDIAKLEVVLFDEAGQVTHTHELTADEDGYYSGQIEGLSEGSRYMYRLEVDRLRPDPASRFQPRDVHGVSQVVGPDFDWHDRDWHGLPLEELVIYETHIGTATSAGTFEAFVEKLDHVKSLGATAIEIMPVADFPGGHNWGYDGVDLFAPAHTYGGPTSLKRLIDAAHAQGLAVLLDVVYNHFGPDGNYLRDFSPDYFTNDKKSPWGDALNFANPNVREFFIANALYWAHEYHIDGLRLDAAHWLVDDSPTHIMTEMVSRVHQSLPTDRNFVVIAEDDRNLDRLLEPAHDGGYGLDGLWADDFHHHVRSALAGDNEGYFVDYTGSATDLSDTLSKGWFYVGQLSRNAGVSRGTDASRFDPAHFVYCIQNHDQIGNRALGERLNQDIGPADYRAASALLLLSPYTPLLFQGQEWAASTPFMYFTDHNAELGALISKGRREEFAHFAAFSHTSVPDPQAPKTFEGSKLDWAELTEPTQAATLALYRDLLALRHQKLPASRRTRQNFSSTVVDRDAIALRYSGSDGGDLLVVVNLKGDLNLNLAEADQTKLPADYHWQPLLSTEETRYGGATDLSQWDRTVLRAEGSVAIVLEAVKTIDLAE